MRLTTVIILSGVVWGSGSAVCVQGGAQAGWSASSSTSVEASKSGATASSNSSASTSGNAGRSSAALSNGTAMNAALSQPVDAKKNEPDDPVTANKTEATNSEGKLVIPQGWTQLEHVTESNSQRHHVIEQAVHKLFD